MMDIAEINNHLIKINKLLDIIETQQTQPKPKNDTNELYGGNSKKEHKKSLFINGLPLGLQSITDDDDVNLDIMDLDNKIYSSMKTAMI
jgi:hypothetical protein